MGKNEGVSIARNYGLERASGKYIWFVDGDNSLSLSVTVDNKKYGTLNYLDKIITSYKTDILEFVRIWF